MVGARGFEPPTPSPPAKCATRLRHAPTLKKLLLSIEKKHLKCEQCMVDRSSYQAVSIFFLRLTVPQLFSQKFENLRILSII
jgi:hypothetical protein